MNAGIAPEDRLLALIRDGEALLGRERRAVLGGAFGTIAEIATGKQALLAEIDGAIGTVRGTPALRSALARLIRASRRNERILRAAKAGIAAARRRIAAIEATRRGDVAYQADGSRIVSRAVAEGKSSRA